MKRCKLCPDGRRDVLVWLLSAVAVPLALLAMSRIDRQIYPWPIDLAALAAASYLTFWLCTYVVAGCHALVHRRTTRAS